MRPTTFFAFAAGMVFAIWLMHLQDLKRDAVDVQRAQINHCDKAEALTKAQREFQ